MLLYVYTSSYSLIKSKIGDCRYNQSVILHL